MAAGKNNQIAQSTMINAVINATSISGSCSFVNITAPFVALLLDGPRSYAAFRAAGGVPYI
jgi:hypothetical protein